MTQNYNESRPAPAHSSGNLANEHVRLNDIVSQKEQFSESIHMHRSSHIRTQPCTPERKLTYFHVKTRTEFLASLADNNFLVRDGKMISTSTFINSATQTVQLVFVFFTPRSGLVTVLDFTADLSQDQLVQASSVHIIVWGGT